MELIIEKIKNNKKRKELKIRTTRIQFEIKCFLKFKWKLNNSKNLMLKGFQ